jgi:hypothetical protein
MTFLKRVKQGHQPRVRGGKGKGEKFEEHVEGMQGFLRRIIE